MLPCFEAGQSPPESTTVDQWVQALPGLLLFLLLLNLIVKLAGYEPSGKYLRSCVGSQCMVAGVFKQTSKNFFHVVHALHVAGVVPSKMFFLLD